MIIYKFDVASELRKVGVTAASAKKTRIFSQETMSKFKRGDTNISVDTLNRLCCILELQPRDILKYIETDSDRADILKIEKT